MRLAGGRKEKPPKIVYMGAALQSLPNGMWSSERGRQGPAPQFVSRMPVTYRFSINDRPKTPIAAPQRRSITDFAFRYSALAVDVVKISAKQV